MPPMRLPRAGWRSSSPLPISTMLHNPASIAMQASATILPTVAPPEATVSPKLVLIPSSWASR